jgi:hypothetical protein
MSQRRQAGTNELGAGKATNAATLAPGKPDFLNDWSLRIEGSVEEKMPAARHKLALSAAIAGIVFVVLYTLGYYLVAQSPPGNATDAEIAAYYGNGQMLSLAVAGMFAMPYAGIAFLYFMVMLRALARASGIPFSRVLANVQFGAGLLFLALLFGAAAAQVATTASMQFAGIQPDPVAVRILPFYGATLLVMFAMRMAAMFVFTTVSMAWATHLIPAWFRWLSYMVGVLLLLAATFAAWFALLFAGWVFVLCVLILVRQAASAAVPAK